MRHSGFTLALPLVVALFGAPAFAKDADPVGQLIAGYTACLMADDNVAKVTELLAADGWTAEPSDEEGLIYLSPGEGAPTFAYMADDGSFCHVESTAVSSARAMTLLHEVLDKAKLTGIKPDKDGMGCERLNFDSGRSATVTSGGNDPTCASDTDSGVRFDSAGADN